MAHEQPWHYFLGSEGNREGYSRAGCEWFDEPARKWKRCFPFGRPTDQDGEFLPQIKYRRKIT